MLANKFDQMRIVELNTITDTHANELKVLVKELNPNIIVSSEMLRNAAESDTTHLFAMVEDDGRIIGTASLCVFDSPTGRKASVEDVVVLSSHRGQHIGKKIVEYLIDFARNNLGDVDLHLISHPTRIAANALYQSLGFEKRDTNVFLMKIRQS